MGKNHKKGQKTTGRCGNWSKTTTKTIKIRKNHKNSTKSKELNNNNNNDKKLTENDEKCTKNHKKGTKNVKKARHWSKRKKQRKFEEYIKNNQKTVQK